MRNRLRLDFSLQSAKEREAFIEEYLQAPIFQKKPPSEKERTIIADYILWGKNKDGSSSIKNGEYEIDTKSKTWDRKDLESLDGLLESPTFSEAQIQQNPIQLRIAKEVFSREETRAETSGILRDTFESLWRNIDEVDLEICLYEERTGKRKTPPRAQLLQRFSEEEITKAREKAAQLNQRKYLELRHLLVELRREQYTLRDSYRPSVLPKIFVPYSEKDDRVIWGENIQVRPIGVLQNNPTSEKIFGEDFPNPKLFGEKEIRKVLEDFYDLAAQERIFFDFCEEEHVYQLINFYEELEESAAREDFWGLTGKLLKTFEWYRGKANLTEPQELILDLKMKKVKNQEIAARVNREFGKNYTTNYISTIFKKNIVKGICRAAKYHREIVKNLGKAKAFKVCNTCGRTLLICEDNFMKKANSIDGFAAKCKSCDKKRRNAR